MGKYVNLDQIVNYVYESEFDEEPTAETRESKKNSRYENVREQLTQIFDVLDFCVDLIKDKNKGFTGKGIYIFPKQDGGFIEWLISKENQDNCRALKTGDFSKCEKTFLKKTIDGLIDILKHLDVPDEIIKMQQDIMEQKTMVYISYEAQKMWHRLYRSMYSIANIMEVAPPFMPYEDEKKFWMKFSDDLDSFLNQKEKEYMEQERAFRKEILADAPRLTKEEVEFSMRSYNIMNELAKNDEFMKLKQEYMDMYLQGNKKTAQGRKKNEKRKKQIIDRQYEIFRKITREHPLDIEQMTTIEKIMTVNSDTRFSLFYVQADGNWAIIETKKFYRTERIWQARHPSDNVAEELYLEKM